MDYSWNGLADRCQLFTDADRPLLIELLKEAQSEISNECKLYDAVFTYIGGDLGYMSGRNTNYGVLPVDFLEDVGVWCNSTQLKKMSERDFSYRDSGSDNYRRNVPDSGSPNFYYISGGHIQFNSNPNDTDEIMLYYKARISSPDLSKLTYFKANTDNEWVDFPYNLKNELKGLTLLCNSFSVIQLQYMHSTVQTFPTVLDPFYYNTASAPNPDILFPMCNRYSGAFGGDPEDGVRMGQITNFGKVAPVIPAEYHLMLCDYAVALASAKKNPEMYDKHLTLWTARIQDAKNKDTDKDLMFNIREVV